MIVNVPHLRPKLLLHGAPEDRFPAIQLSGEPTCAGDQPGCEGYPHGFVFASHNYFHAAAYGFKKYAINVGGCSVTREGTRGYIPTIILAPKAHAPDADIYSEVREQICFLHSLCSCSFEGVYPKDGYDPARMPLEWVNGNSVDVINVMPIPNDVLVQQGFQVYSINPHAVRKRTGLDDEAFMEILRRQQPKKTLEEIAFVDEQTRRDITSNAHNPARFAALCQAGLLKLENLRPEYDGVPGARPRALLRIMGKRNFDGFRQTLPLSALQP